MSTNASTTGTGTGTGTDTGAATTDAKLSTWTLDPDHTQVWFAVKHMMFATVKGQFPGVSGELRLHESDPSKSVVNVTIDAATIDTRSGQRDEHLRSADFFDVANHPHLTFVSRRIEPVGGSKFRVTGDLTIRDTTREVVLDVEETGRGKDPWGQQKLGFTASTSIDRKDYGLMWNQALEAGGVLVSDEVKITIDGQAAKK